jgi:hypothetical protein
MLLIYQRMTMKNDLHISVDLSRLGMLAHFLTYTFI